MLKVTSVEAQSRFGELIDRAQREPIAVTRHGRTVAYVVSAADRVDEESLGLARAEAARWYTLYLQTLANDAVAAAAPPLDDASVDRLVHDLR